MSEVNDKKINTWPFPYQAGYHAETPISAQDTVSVPIWGSRDDNRADMEMVMY
jgi:hypothetical protein